MTVADRFVDKFELAAVLKVSTRTIERLAARGMPAYRPSRRVMRFDLGEVTRWLEARRTTEGE